MHVEIDDEYLDLAFRENLKWHLDNSSKRLKELNKIKNPMKHERDELEYQKKLLPALKIVGEYYGVDIKIKI